MKKIIIITIALLCLQFANCVSKKYIMDKIEYYARLYNIEDCFLKAIIETESSFNPYARCKNDSNGYYSKGLCQINEAYHSGNLYQIDYNIKLGCKILTECLILSHGNYSKCLMYYNAGYSKIEIQKKVPYKTKLYVKKVMTLYYYFKIDELYP